MGAISCKALSNQRTLLLLAINEQNPATQTSPVMVSTVEHATCTAQVDSKAIRQSNQHQYNPSTAQQPSR
jgi:hypothetical protein